MCAKNGQPVTYLIYFLLAIWMVFDIQTAAATENHPEGAQVQLNLNFKSDLNSNLQEAFRKEFRCNQQYQWIPVSVEIDEIGNSHSRYLQYFENIPVKGAILIVHKELSGKATVSGTYVKIETLILNKYLSETEILQALNIRNQSNAQLIWVYEEGSKSYIKAYEINDNDYHKVLIAAASDGKLVAVSDHNCYADVNGSAVTAYYGTQQIATNFDQINYTLKTASRGKGIETFNLNGNNNYLSKTEFIDQDNHWDQSVPATERFATDAHYCAVAYYDFLQHKFSRNSIDNNGQKLISYLNYGSGLLNAFWNGSAVVYGGGNASGTPLTTLDIAGHEFTHGLIQKTANLNYAGQPGTINESLADMLGTALEFYADSLNANWIIGDQSGNILRSLSEPSLYNQPDTYLGDHWYYGTGDNGGVHINSGFMNKWFYLLAEGGQGVNDFGTSYQVTGIGVDEATRIVYNTMIAYLVPSSDYVDFKNATIQSAALIFGTCSPQYLSVLQCWKAVGLGQGINEPLLLEAPVNNTICRGETITLKAIGLPGSVYTWYNDSIQISSGLPSEISVANGGSWMVSENRCGVILNSEIVEVIVNDLPIVSTVNLSTCSEEMVTLSGFPSGGNFNIANPYSGNSTSFIYQFTDSNGCNSSAIGTIVVHPKPNVVITNSQFNYPVNHQPVVLTGNVPGTFSGTGVSNNTFDPSQAGIGGPYPIYLNYTNSYGCASADTVFMNVNEECKRPMNELKIIGSAENVLIGQSVKLYLNLPETGFDIIWKIPSGCTALSPLQGSEITVILTGENNLISAELINTCNEKFRIEKTIITENSNSLFDVDIYPVPAIKTITIKSGESNVTGAISMKIYSVNGDVLLQEPAISNEELIDISHLAAGIYFVEVIHGNQIIRKRIVKSVD